MKEEKKNSATLNLNHFHIELKINQHCPKKPEQKGKKQLQNEIGPTLHFRTALGIFLLIKP